MANRVADLTVKLTADSATFKTDVERAKHLLRGYKTDAKGAEKSSDTLGGAFARMGKRTGGVVAGLGEISAAGSIWVGVVGAMTLAQANQAREWDAMALRSGQTVGVMQSMAFATAKYNISADKTADILKDLTDKTGDFLATGGGEFADFFENIAPKVGLTAQALAEMSGPNALIALKSAMDQTN
ncbi:MAG: hypothetical protein RPR40_13635, partial [Bermanella sp.]